MSISPSDPTISDPHRLLLAGKNLQALSRLYHDLLPLLEVDPRLHIAFSVIPGSHFESAAHRFLRELERQSRVVVIPWSTVEQFAPALIVSASPTAELFKFDIPFLVVTHGAGNNRLRTDLSGVYGLAPEQLLGPKRWPPWRKRRVLDWLPLAGPAALAQLRKDCPEALAVAEIVGDLCHERMLLSRVLRREYRRALGIKRGQRFVVVSSTWGDLSLVGEGHADLPESLLASLPMDEFNIGVIPHPNIEHGGGPSIAGVFAPWLKNGMIMPQIHEGWRAMLIAADVVVGDSGSVTQYAAAIGRPVLLSAFGFDQMPPDGALAEFGRTTPWLNPDKPLVPQLLEAIDRGQHFDFSRILARDRSPSQMITAKVYAILGLPAPEIPEPKLLPEAELHFRYRPTSAWNFTIQFDHGESEWTRRPASVPREVTGTLVVRYLECDDRRILARGDVLLHHRDSQTTTEALFVVDELLEDWQHSRMVSVRIGDGRLLLGTRGGLRIGVRCDPELMDIIPAALHVWLLERASNPTGFHTPDAFVDFQRLFKSPPAFFAV